MCTSDSDCDPEVCVDGTCQPKCVPPDCDPSCANGELDPDEGDTDCGGPCPDKCKTGDTCQVDEDCEQGVCDSTCQAPTCDDRVTNGGEPSTDCGAVCPTLCQNGDACFDDEDCESQTCAEDVCAPPECSNGVQDADAGETDKDCGGDTECPRCETGKMCKTGDDCIDKICEADKCAAPTCDDKAQNGDETGEDCGGDTECDRCDAGQPCVEASDCVSGVCTDDECQSPACDDKVRNGAETDKDCGGEDCDGCPPDARCIEATDCESLVCELAGGDTSERRCLAPTCDDQLQNGSELGIDCGGEDCNLCQLGDDCSDDEGCASFSCEDGACVNGISVDYNCEQCGEATVTDKIYYTVTLTNRTNHDIDLGGVTIRYYLSAEATGNLTFDCVYGATASCGADPRLLPSGLDNIEATHVIQTTLGNTLDLLPAGANVAVSIEVLLNMQSMNQGNDYSFNKNPQTRYERITLYREGSLIWGMPPN